jgi:uncharacterized membrane protein (DUF2068 family)
MTTKDKELALRAIIALKAVKALILFVFAGAAFTLREDLTADAERLVTWLGINAGRPTIRKLLHISPDHVVWIGVGSVLYAAVFTVEAWGLHRRKRWAEWLTVVVTASLIPFEIYELVENPSIAKIGALVINIAVVIYLVIRRLRDR